MARTLLGALLNRAGTATTTPVPFASRAQSYGRGLFGSQRGTTAQLDSMGAVSTLFAIVNRTAKAEAGVEWGLYRKAKSGLKEDRQPVTAHAALDLWNRPNPYFTQSVFVEAGAQHKQLTGEQWWVIARDERSTLPLEMWVVRPDRIRPVPDPDLFLVGYMYTGPDGQEVALRKEDVIFTRTPHPTDPYRGIGPVQALLTDLDAVRYSAEWNRSFFLNSAEPGGIIEVPNGLSDEEFAELQARWNEQHKGVANAHRVAILEHGQWKDRKYSQRDMQFAELRNLSREVIREAFGFPKPMLGSVDDVNRANGESGERMFARWLIVPDLEAMRDALNNQLLPLYGRTGEGLEFDFCNPVPDDVEKESTQLTARANAAKALGDAGLWHPDDILSAVGLPEMRRVAAPAPAPAAVPAASWGEAVAGLLGEDIENAQRWVVKIVDDGDTCLAPEVRVTTRSGLVPAKDVTLNDELLTHSGRWMTPSRIVVSEVEEQLTRVHLADGRSLRLTWDHPVLVRDDEGFAWRNAGDLTVGDLVIDQSSLELSGEARRVDLDLGQTPDGVPPAGDVFGLPAVNVGAQRVPVRAVRLDDEPVANHEVDDPGADLDLGAVGVPQVFEGLADTALDAGLRVTGPVAAHRAVPLAGDDRGQDPHLIPAVLAGNDHGRAAAGLGAVPAVLGLGVAERGAAAGAGSAPAPGVVAACACAVGVPVGDANGDIELDTAASAGLGDATTFCRCHALDVLGVSSHALARAVDLVAAPPARDLDRAALAPRRGVTRVLSQPGRAAGTAEAERPSLDRLTAARTHLVHGQSVQVNAVQIRAVDQELHVGEVYDFTIPDDETFWAEGVLVHNCSPCRENNGKTYKNRQQAYEDYPGGEGYVRCEGVQYGNPCRCKVVKRGRKGEGS